jgi:hypothetical protein
MLENVFDPVIVWVVPVVTIVEMIAFRLASTACNISEISPSVFRLLGAVPIKF